MFEYWTHALSYVPTRDFRFFLAAMKRHRRGAASLVRLGHAAGAAHACCACIRKDGALTIRDIDDDVLVEKDHPWASRKPSKRALQLAFYGGALTISARAGMLKTYELMERHFGWEKPPAAGDGERQITELPARPRAALAGHRQPRFGLPPRRQAQARHPRS